MDGLMIDSERLYFEAQREIAARYGKQVQERTLWKMMGRKPMESLEVFRQALNLDMNTESLFEMRNGIMRRKLKEDLKPMPGLFQLIDRLFGRAVLAVATGAQQEFLDIVVDRLQIRDKFSILQSSDGITRGKPNPEIYRLTCKKIGSPPARCAVLEDSANGVRAASSAGCYTVAVPSRYTSAQDFSLAHRVVGDLKEAGDYLEPFLASKFTVSRT
jgi:HAD superfamily hydrolase (TIGR01509 family)